MRMIAAALIAITPPGLAGAQTIADGVNTMTPYGQVTIRESDDGWSRYLDLGGARFFDTGDFRFIDLIDRRGGLILVQLFYGGNGCPSDYAWLNVVADPPFATEVFGNCSDLPEVSSDSETVTVTLPATTAADGFTAFIYDGRTIRQETAGQQSAGIAPGNATAWIGRHPGEIFRAADWRDMLVGLMGEDAYIRAGNTIELASPMERRGDWVVGSGCIKFTCDEDFGVIALHVLDGRVLVALHSMEGGELWGDAAGAVPEAIRDVLAR